jgi:hypothetical protein
MGGIRKYPSGIHIGPKIIEKIILEYVPESYGLVKRQS